MVSKAALTLAECAQAMVELVALEDHVNRCNYCTQEAKDNYLAMIRKARAVIDRAANDLAVQRP